MRVSNAVVLSIGDNRAAKAFEKGSGLALCEYYLYTRCGIGIVLRSAEQNDTVLSFVCVRAELTVDQACLVPIRPVERQRLSHFERTLSWDAVAFNMFVFKPGHLWIRLTRSVPVLLVTDTGITPERKLRRCHVAAPRACNHIPQTARSR